MAISLKTAGTWAESTAASTLVALPGTVANGDRYFVFAAWKDYSITASMPAGWTKIPEFTDGSTGTGNGTGSMKVACWYRDWVTGNTWHTTNAEHTITYSTATNLLSAAVGMLWQKAAGDRWAAATYQNGDWPNQGSSSASAQADSGAITLASGAAVMALIGIRDDSATFTRPTTGISLQAGTATWTGNYVESPATHHSSTTGNDMSADLGHRFVNEGAASCNLQVTATLSANETGAILWVHQPLVDPNQNIDGSLAVTAGLSGTGAVSVSALRDRFTTENTTLWSGYASADVAAAGTLTINSTAAYPALVSVDTYNLTTSAASVEVRQMPTTGQVLFALRIDANNLVGIRTNSTCTTLYFVQILGGVEDATSVAYDAAAHRYWRIRHSDQLYYDTSPNGIDWTQRRALAVSIAQITALYARFSVGWGTAPSGTAVFDDFNFAPQALAGTLAVTADLSGAARLNTHQGITGSLEVTATGSGTATVAAGPLNQDITGSLAVTATGSGAGSYGQSAGGTLLTAAASAPPNLLMDFTAAPDGAYTRAATGQAVVNSRSGSLLGTVASGKLVNPNTGLSAIYDTAPLSDGARLIWFDIESVTASAGGADGELAVVVMWESPLPAGQVGGSNRSPCHLLCYRTGYVWQKYDSGAGGASNIATRIYAAPIGYGVTARVTGYLDLAAQTLTVRGADGVITVHGPNAAATFAPGYYLCAEIYSANATTDNPVGILRASGDSAVGGRLSGSGVFGQPATGTLTVTAALSGTARANTHQGIDGSLSVAAGLSGAGVTDQPTGGALPATAGFTGVAVTTSALRADGSLDAAAAPTGTADLGQDTSGTLPGTAAPTGLAALGQDAAGTLAATADLTGGGRVNTHQSVGGDLTAAVGLSGASVVDLLVGGALALAAGLSGVAETAGGYDTDGALTATAAATGAARLDTLAGGVLAANAVSTGTAAYGRPAAGTLAVTVTLGGEADVTSVPGEDIGGSLPVSVTAAGAAVLGRGAGGTLPVAAAGAGTGTVSAFPGGDLTVVAAGSGLLLFTGAIGLVVDHDTALRVPTRGAPLNTGPRGGAVRVAAVPDSTAAPGGGDLATTRDDDLTVPASARVITTAGYR